MIALRCSSASKGWAARRSLGAELSEVSGPCEVASWTVAGQGQRGRGGLMTRPSAERYPSATLPNESLRESFSDIDGMVEGITGPVRS